MENQTGGPGLPDLSKLSTDEMCRTFFPQLLQGQQQLSILIGQQNIMIEELKGKVKKLESRVDYLEEQNEKLYGMAREDYLIFTGLPEDEKDPILLPRMIEKYIQDSIKVVTKVESARRFGPKKDDRPRRVSVKFQSINDRNQVWFNRKSFGHNVFVNRDEHPNTRSKTFTLLRESKRAKEENKQCTINWRNYTIDIAGTLYKPEAGKLILIKQ